MKRISALLIVAAIFAAPCFGQDDVKLVYPMAAADTELDNSTPQKRTTPPVREEDEVDPVTPLGQIRGVLDGLDNLQNQSASILEKVNKLQTTDNRDILGFLERGATKSDSIAGNVENILEQSKSVAAKIEALQKTMADLRATVESVEKTAASVEKIRNSRWTDYAVVLILALVIIQLVWRACSSISGVIKARAAKWQEIMRIYEQHNANAENAKQ